jgi:hypothetical protein
MIIEYILVGVIAFSVGAHSTKKKHNNCEHTKVVVVHKHKKHKKFHRFGRKLKRKHYHKNGTINMMCTNGWRW